MPDINITVRSSADLSAAEQLEIAALLAVAFGEEDESYTWAHGEWYVLIRTAEGILTSMLEILARTVTVADHPVRVGGIGGVCTHPDYRLRGHSTSALRVAASFLRDEMCVPFGLLLTDDEVIPFYARLGWRVAEDALTFAQPNERTLTHDGINMILPLGADPWPAGPIDLCGLPW